MLWFLVDIDRPIVGCGNAIVSMFSPPQWNTPRRVEILDQPRVEHQFYGRDGLESQFYMRQIAPFVGDYHWPPDLITFQY